MQYDDFFVVLAELLSYLYLCLKKGEHPDPLRYSAAAYGIVGGYWQYIIDEGFREGFVESQYDIRYGEDHHHVTNGDIRITPKGIEYLQTAEVMKNAIEVVRQIGGYPAEVLYELEM